MSFYARTRMLFQAVRLYGPGERPYSADEYAFIRQRQVEIAGINRESHGEPANLREAIERGMWWPDEVITDGADHFTLPRAGADLVSTLSRDQAKRRTS